jgi:hypothetical protein
MAGQIKQQIEKTVPIKVVRTEHSGVSLGGDSGFGRGWIINWAILKELNLTAII